MSVAIEFRSVSKRYPGLAAPAVADLSFTVPAGSSLALVGPSGCGKTTTLKMINRLIEPNVGEIRLEAMRASGRCPCASCAAASAT